MKFLWPCAVVFLLAAGLRADTYIFKWVDGQGAVHITDRLGDVPQPYRSLYAAEVKRREADKEKLGTAQEPPKTAAPVAERSTEGRAESAADRIGRDRARWKKLVADWRARLKASTEALDGIDGQIVEARANPLLRHTPQVKEKVAALETRRARQLAEVEKARDMLLRGIPEKARKAQVPPKWLE